MKATHLLAYKKICLDIALGLAAIHQCAIIHSDDKLANILLCKTPSSRGNDWAAKVANPDYSY
jgi:serine/threonine protein kinase